MKSKGKLMLIGGNIDRGTEETPKGHGRLNFFELGILRRILKELGENNAGIEIITSASKIPGEIGEEYRQAFEKLNFHNAGIMDPGRAAPADDPEMLERIKKTSGVMFTGGDQNKLVERIGNTAFHKLLKKRFNSEKNFLISGTSAGAMAMAKIMIRESIFSQALLKGTVKSGKGLGLIDNLIVETHFAQPGRFTRLIESVAAHPHLPGIGLGENTAVLLKDEMLECVGLNLVVIIDGSNMSRNNYHEIKEGEELAVENMSLHALPKGNIYHLVKKLVFSKAA